ncbi:hypothetical protein PoB_001188900 [Plakobranchus ocellatus]|uniref:G-protein coupled receptors family 1 profile domain-containing protein n=1 Tax=Plakobranchus ocellatus TaxID=259542 RepID=A0AAV3YTM3_9GAST|nr:hypothetical protein PoB_001188900 [Plakobranchus ocellatus]
MTRSGFIFNFDFKHCSTYDSSQCSYEIFILVAILAFLAPIIPGSYFYLAWLAHRLKSHLTNNQDKDMQTDQQISSVSSVSVQFNDDSTRDILSLKGQYSSITQNDMILADIRTLLSPSPLPSDKKCSFHLSQSPNLVLPKEKNQSMSHNSSALLLSDNNSAKAKSPTSHAPSCNSLSPSLQIHAYQSHLSMNKHISKNVHHVHVKDNLGLNSKYLSQTPSQFVDTAVQTSLPYETSIEDSEEWNSSGSSVSEIPLEETLPYHLKSSLLSSNVLTEKLEKIANASYQTLLMPSKINTAENTLQVQYSNDSSQQAKMMLEPPRPAQCLAFQNQREYNLGHANSSAASRRRPVKNLLNQAVSTFCQHGLILMVTVYGCSLPFALVNKCSMLDLPFSAATLAAGFYYSSCIWYPVVYFFTSANFRQQLSITTVGGHS